jgi:hypothetical protein
MGGQFVVLSTPPNGNLTPTSSTTLLTSAQFNNSPGNAITSNVGTFPTTSGTTFGSFTIDLGTPAWTNGGTVNVGNLVITLPNTHACTFTSVCTMVINGNLGVNALAFINGTLTISSNSIAKINGDGIDMVAFNGATLNIIISIVTSFSNSSNSITIGSGNIEKIIIGSYCPTLAILNYGSAVTLKNISNMNILQPLGFGETLF